jgi:hypothetical protein
MMTRLIDADALKSALAHAAKDYCKRNGPMRTIYFESLIDKAPTIDAIPVEWIENVLKELLKSSASFETCGAISAILVWWQEEQEAR